MPIIGTLPNNILAGQPVSAAPVMGNFNFIVAQVNANSAASANFSDFETPTGLINGSNTTFTIAHTANPPASCVGYIRQGGAGAFLPAVQGIDFTLAGTVITMSSAPSASSNLFFSYRY